MKKLAIIRENSRIEFFLTRKHIRNIYMRISDEAQISVSAPHWMPESRVLEFVNSRSAWIQKKITEISIKKTWTELIPERRLLLFDDLPDESVLFERNSYKRIMDLTGNIFNKSLQNALIISKTAISPQLSIRRMVSRWGTCNIKKRIITVNFYLIYLPPICTEYIMLHEVLHFRIPNHSKHFYDAVTELMPSWKEAKKLLKDFDLRRKASASG